MLTSTVSSQSAGFSIPVAIVSALGAFVLSMVSTYFIRYKAVLDVPNRRSAHKTSRPTLGGIGIILGFWGGSLCILFFAQGLWGNREWIALGVMTLATAVVIIDDLIRPLKVWEKTALQFIAVVCLLNWGGSFETITLPFMGVWTFTGIEGQVITAVWLMAICNIVNFMDGIDGLVSVHTALVCLFVLLWNVSGDVGLSYMVLSFLFAIFGFLIYNFPPASIFMGDVGSFFIGFFLGTIGIMGEAEAIPWWIYLLPLSFFLHDTLYTLIRRIINRENILVAHNKHLYQRLSRIGWSNFRICMVTLIVPLIGGGAGSLLLSEKTDWGVCSVFLMGLILVLGTFWVERNSDF